MLLSVLVRSCNDETQIAGSLAAIFSQRTEDEVEVIVCDDGTRGFLAGLGGRIRLLPRPPGPYFPGRTLNALVRAARGEIVVFNNADAVPLDERWLEGLVAPLKAGAADATFANQLPRADATALVRRDYLRAFGDGQAAATWPRFFSLASAAARRADLLAHPFDETLHYSEDVEWAYRRPIRRVYVPTARVEHSHNYTMAELRRRFYGEGYADAQVFGDPPPGVVTAACAALRAAARDVAWLARSPACLRELPSALPRRLVQQFGRRLSIAPDAFVLVDVPAEVGDHDVFTLEAELTADELARIQPEAWAAGRGYAFSQRTEGGVTTVVCTVTEGGPAEMSVSETTAFAEAQTLATRLTVGPNVAATFQAPVTFVGAELVIDVAAGGVVTFEQPVASVCTAVRKTGAGRVVFRAANPAFRGTWRQAGGVFDVRHADFGAAFDVAAGATLDLGGGAHAISVTGAGTVANGALKRDSVLGQGTAFSNVEIRNGVRIDVRAYDVPSRPSGLAIGAVSGTTTVSGSPRRLWGDETAARYRGRLRVVDGTLLLDIVNPPGLVISIR